MTDLDLGREFRSVATALEMGWDEMTAVALDGVEASWLDPGEKAELRADFEREIAAIPPP
jgi:adenosine deaminase